MHPRDNIQLTNSFQALGRGRFARQRCQSERNTVRQDLADSILAPEVPTGRHRLAKIRDVTFETTGY